MKAQGQRDLAKAQPPGSGARRPAASCLFVSFRHLFPAEPRSAPPRAWDTRRAGGSQEHRQVTPAGSATLALQAWAVAQTVSPSAELVLPRSPRGRRPRQCWFGETAFFPAIGTAQPAPAVPSSGLVQPAWQAAPLWLHDFPALHWERAWPCPQISQCSLERGRIRNQ